MPVALLTDFGTRDYYVAAMKGVILAINSKAVIVDITHEIEPQAIASAAFVLRACYRDFPASTVFCCVVDPGVGSKRRAIIAATNGQFFVGPDNGLFSFLYDDAVEITSIENDRYFRKPVSSTFHGRDIFAPVAAHLSLGVPPHEFGPSIEDAVRSKFDPVQIHDGLITATVIHIDRFGNVVTDLPSGQIPDWFEAEINGHAIKRAARTYADLAENELAAISGSAGFTELSMQNASAAAVLKARVGDKLIVRSLP